MDRNTSPTGVSRRGKPYSQYVKLPSDDALVALWEANERDYARTAHVIGCTPGAVGIRIRKLGLWSPRLVARGPTYRLNERIDALLATVEVLTKRVAALERRPGSIGGSRIVEWRPDHRRHADGGKPVRAQRREVGLSKRPKAVA